jgi:hypothetical protein
MIIRYKQTVEYEINVTPGTILKNAIAYCISTRNPEPAKLYVSLEDTVGYILEDNGVTGDNNFPPHAIQVGCSQPRNPYFPKLHEDEDPFHGVGITIEGLEENLKNLQQKKRSEIWKPKYLPHPDEFTHRTQGGLAEKQEWPNG